jgi:hypothetical protein
MGIAGTNAVAQIAPDGVSRAMMEKLPGIDMSVGTPGSAVAEAGAERSRQGRPADPVWNSIDSRLEGAVKRGEAAVGNLLND